jgi:hypothetical protein
MAKMLNIHVNLTKLLTKTFQIDPNIFKSHVVQMMLTICMSNLQDLTLVSFFTSLITISKNTLISFQQSVFPPHIF